jgi:UDP-glucuronate 4-epimerase
MMGISAQINLLPMQPGDVLETSADTSALEAAIGFKPRTDLQLGLAQFVAWYRRYYQDK